MRRIVLIVVMILAASSVFAQPKWAIKASGAIGVSLNSGTYTSYYGDRYWHHDRWEDIYDNSELFLDAALGFRVYALKWLYFGADVSYSQIKNKYDFFYLMEEGAHFNPTLKLDGLGVSFIAGFTFPNKSRFYPFAEIGLMPYFTFNDDFHDRDVYFGANFKVGGGFKVTEMLAIELAFTSTMLYDFESDRHYYYDDYHYYSDHSLELNGGIGASLGLVFNF